MKTCDDNARMAYDQDGSVQASGTGTDPDVSAGPESGLPDAFCRWRESAPDARDEIPVDSELLWAALMAAAGRGEDLEIQVFTQACEMAEAMVKRENTPENLAALAACCDLAAGVLGLANRKKEALAYFTRSSSLDGAPAVKDVLADSPGVDGTAGRILDTWEVWDRTNDALAMYTRCLSLREKIGAQQNAAASFWQHLTCPYYYRMAVILESIGRLGDAVAYYRKILAVEEQLIQEDASPENRMELSDGYIYTADVLEAMDRTDDAMENYEAAYSICEQLVQERDAPADWRSLRSVLTNMAELLEKSGRTDDALDRYQRAIAIGTKLIRKYNLELDNWCLGDACGKAGDLLKKSDPDRALRFYKQQLTALEQAARLQGPEPRSPGFCNVYACCVKIADFLKEQGNLDEALPMYENAIELGEIHAADLPWCRSTLCRAYESAADILDIKDQPDRAAELIEKDLQHLDILAQEQDTREAWRALFKMYDELEFALLSRGKLGAYRKIRKKCRLSTHVYIRSRLRRISGEK